MLKRMGQITRAAALLAAVCLLCGCMPRVRVSVSVPVPTNTPAPTATPAPTPTPEPTLSPAQQTYGSVGLLSEPTVLVSIYLNDAAGGHTWDEESMAQTRQNVALAVQWITEQAAAYGTEATLYYDDGSEANAPLCHSYLVQTRLQGGNDGEYSNEFYTEMQALCATLNTEALQEKYGTDRVGFLIHLPLAGVSFTMVHYQEDGPDYYEEYSCLYRYDSSAGDTVPEAPAVYAHEILHQFGAPDLYRGSVDAFVTDALQQYIQENYPDEIMFSTYNSWGGVDYDGIYKTMCPLVAYRLGLVESCDELAQFPAVAQPEPGTFTLDTLREDTGPGPGPGNEDKNDGDSGGNAGGPHWPVDGGVAA